MLALEPRVLILDEPTSNLDPAGTADVLATIDRVRSMVDLTVMVIEHEVDEVFDRVDSVLLVEDQHVQGPFSPREFISERGLHVRDEMGLWIPQAAEVGLELRSHGIATDTIPLNGDELVEAVSKHGAFPLAEPPAVEESPAEPVPAETVIEVDNVSFSYGTREVLKGVNLTASRGELLAIVGQNGSGKSTLASLFNGINEPSGGEVRVEGKATTDYQFAHLVKRVAYIFQLPEKQFIRNTVFDEIAHGLRALGMPDESVEAETLGFLETVRLAERRDASPYVLSHGQKRRLSVACMVVGKPDVVVLDEPTFGQDYHQARNLMQLLQDLADSGASVVFITHDMRLVAEYADRAAVLSDGRVIFDGTPAHLFEQTEVLQQARLKPPSVHDFSHKILGRPVLTTPLLTRRIEEVMNGRN
jgi:energy-coupling factor transport system ATP-binding protein